MKIKYLNGKRIYYAFAAGAQEVALHRDLLNKINVFPVPDGDTGNNLALTLTSVAEGVRPEKSISQTLNSITDAMLSGARGNSGIIMAQFINGLTLEVGDKQQLSTTDFAESVLKAVPYAYNALSAPVEGTMLTVMKDWAEAIFQLRKYCSDFEEILQKSLEEANRSLQRTTNMLKSLRQASVVDSGAQGFVYFLTGITKLIKEGNLRSLTRVNGEQQIPKVAIFDNIDEWDGRYRYCTEVLSNAQEFRTEEIKQRLSYLGDSVIVAGNSRMMRVHIHTNQPHKVVATIKVFGKVTQQKVEDMYLQYLTVKSEHQPIGLVTDSIADVPQEILDKYRIHVLPLNLIIDDEVFLDKMTIQPEQIFKIMDASMQHPTSSQPTTKAVQETLSFLAEHYESIIVITVSKELSGTWSVLDKVAESLRSRGKKISVIDSKLNSGAQGMVVVKAAEEIQSGKNHDEVVATLEQIISRTSIYVNVDTIKYMVRGGRISPMQGWVGKIINLKPIISLDADGRGIAFGNSFSRQGSKRKIMKLVKNIHRERGIDAYSIVHGQAPELAQAYEQELSSLLGKKAQYVSEISSIVALSAGPGCVAVCLTTTD